MKIEVQTIAPADAVKLLATDSLNRKLVRRRVRELAETMQSGGWQGDGAPIRLDVEGNLLDGQHRLAAVIEAGTPIEFVVVSGIDSRTRLVMDTGKSRSFDDYLTMNGIANGRSIAAATRFVWNYEHGIFSWTGSFLNQPQPTLAKLAELYDQRADELADGVRQACAVVKRMRITPTVPAGLWPVLSSIDYDEAADFYDHLSERASGAIFDGVVLLRTRLNNAGRPSFGDRLSQRHQAALTIKAWNAYRAGESLTRLLWRPGGTVKEKFPEPK